MEAFQSLQGTLPPAATEGSDQGSGRNSSGFGIDDRRAFESLDDLDLERFFAAIPGFCDSRKVVDPVGAFIKPNDKKI
jgi:hypothetical protein